MDITRNEIVAVGTSSVVVARLGSNEIAPRKAIIIKNTSPNATDTITINLGMQQAVASKGIILGQGETYADANSEGYISYQGVITAICATATGQLSIMER